MRVIGLISGTSVDGVDAALAEITGSDLDLKVKLLAANTFPYPPQLREQILEVCAGAAISLAELAALDDAIAWQFAQAAQAMGKDNPAAELIGSHGQTIYHRPTRQEEGSKGAGGTGEDFSESSLPSFSSSPPHLPTPTTLGYSLQLGRGEVIAQLTKVKTVSNFRAADIATGGEGAPLVSRVDAYLLSHPSKNRCIQNIGGIGNVTYLPARQGNWIDSICGWDTGPGNALLDLAVEYFTDGSQTYDQDGQWAAQGTPCQALVREWLSLDFFQTAPPKSTGRELFSADYLKHCLAQSADYNLTQADTLATLAELTAASIAHSYYSFLPQLPDEVFLCGGGSHNLYLRQRLEALLSPIAILTTDQLVVNSDFKEAMAFAVLAYWHERGMPGNLPKVTGARAEVVLGELHQPTYT
ncbi:MAG: anhydro-N-acetylmuramic acid kinase [Coleofasciculaceae cyanobacterium]